MTDDLLKLTRSLDLQSIRGIEILKEMARVLKERAFEQSIRSEMKQLSSVLADILPVDQLVAYLASNKNTACSVLMVFLILVPMIEYGSPSHCSARENLGIR